MITNEEIEKIQKSANIVDIISSYISLTQKGKNYFGVCPFHEDHSPSMSVSEEKQIYKCFSCGAAGNVFTFVSEYENVKFLEAVKIVADKCGIPFQGVIKREKPKNYTEEYEAMNLALKFYQNNLNSKEGVKAKKYLLKRSIDEEIIKDFSLGLAIGGNMSLNQLLLNKGFPKDLLLQLGLINQNNGYINDIFQHRVMFPIHDLEGNVVGFTGRIYEDNSGQAKYINSKESNIFKKGQILFNYHRAAKEIKRKKEVILVEGNMDAIRMYASGIKNVLALMGTSLTKEQVAILKGLRANIILMFDNDTAGEMATYQNGTILEEAGLDFRVVRLSGEKDPDEYILKNGIEALKANIRSPITFLDFKLKYFRKDKDLSKVDDLASYIKEIIKDLKNIPDELTRELTLKKISEDYQVSLDLLKNELGKENSKQKLVEQKKLAKVRISKYDRACQDILYFMMNDEKFILKFETDLGYFREKKYRNLANEIIYYYKEKQKMDISSFISFISTKDYIYDDAMEIIKRNMNAEFDMKAFEEFIGVAKEEAVKQEINDLKKQIANSMDANEEIELAQKLLNLKKGCVGNE